MDQTPTKRRVANGTSMGPVATSPLKRMTSINNSVSPTAERKQPHGDENQPPYFGTPTKKPVSAKKATVLAPATNGDDFTRGNIPAFAIDKSPTVERQHTATKDADTRDINETANQAMLAIHHNGHPAQAAKVTTPRKRSRPLKAVHDDATTTTPKRQRTDLFSTPAKGTPAADSPSKATPGTGRGHGRTRINETPTTRRTMADRSARKKTTRALIDRMVAEDDEDEDEDFNATILSADEDSDGIEDELQHDDSAVFGKTPVVQPPPLSGLSSAAAPANGLDQIPEETEETVAPVPRKRGRPPKNTAGSQARPAARGRPKAPPAPVDPNAPPKRGPGRPRKVVTTDPNAPASAAAPVRELEAPRDQPAHEHFFFHNRSGAASKTSNNTLASLRPLTYDEYFRLRDGGPDSHISGCSRHEKQITNLEDLHAQSFPQWAFELSQGFSVCLYGYGSKQRVLHAFAKTLHKSIPDHVAHKIVMANASPAGIGADAAGGGGKGAAPGSASAAASALRDIMLVVAAAASNYKRRDGPPKLPTGAAAAEKTLHAMLDAAAGSTSAITLIINGIDSPSLRRPAAQATLARLAAHPSIQLLCAADTPGFALMWDGAARSQQNFVFHDATTFRPLAGLDTVDEVNALLGRRVRRVGGKDGAAFVLRSLPENARNLFQLLIGEVLAADEGGGGAVRHRGYGDDDEDDDDYEGGNGRDGGDDHAESVALEYRMLYNKALEEFICSSEMSFRTLLKEFHDHQMVTSRKDAFGTELLSLPFRRDELEGLLEDLAS